MREVLGQTEVFSLGSYNFHSVDIGIALAVTASIVCFFSNKIEFRFYTYLSAAIAVIIIMNLIRGLINDPMSSLSWARSNVGIAAMLTLSFLAAPNYHVVKGLRKTLLWAATSLSFLAILRLCTRPSLFMTNGLNDYFVNDGGRPLSAQGAFIIVLGSGLIFGEYLQDSHRRLRNLLFSLFLGGIVLLTRQGTASIAQICVFVAIFLTQRSSNHFLRLSFAAVATAPLTFFIYSSTEYFVSTADAEQRAHNLSTRKEIWSGLLQEWPRQSFFDQALGLSANDVLPIYIRLNGQIRLWENGIHSMYYGLLPVAGYFGALLFILLITFLTFSSFIRALRNEQAMPSFAFAFFVATAVLSYSYELRSESLLGFYSALICFRFYSRLESARVV